MTVASASSTLRKEEETRGAAADYAGSTFKKDNKKAADAEGKRVSPSGNIPHSRNNLTHLNLKCL